MLNIDQIERIIRKNKKPILQAINYKKDSTTFSTEYMLGKIKRETHLPLVENEELNINVVTGLFMSGKYPDVDEIINDKGYVELNDIRIEFKENKPSYVIERVNSKTDCYVDLFEVHRFLKCFKELERKTNLIELNNLGKLSVNDKCLKIEYDNIIIVTTVYNFVSEDK